MWVNCVNIYKYTQSQYLMCSLEIILYFLVQFLMLFKSRPECRTGSDVAEQHIFSSLFWHIKCNNLSENVRKKKREKKHGKLFIIWSISHGCIWEEIEKKKRKKKNGWGQPMSWVRAPSGVGERLVKPCYKIPFSFDYEDFLCMINIYWL